MFPVLIPPVASLVYRSTTDFADKDALELDASRCSWLQSVLQYHVLPPVMLACGSSKLEDKFHAVMFSFFLEAGSSQRSLSKFSSEVVSLTSDLGTEFLLPSISPVALNDLFPWMEYGQHDFQEIGGPAAASPTTTVGASDFDFLPGDDVRLERDLMHVSLSSFKTQSPLRNPICVIHPVGSKKKSFKCDEWDISKKQFSRGNSRNS